MPFSNVPESDSILKLYRIIGVRTIDCNWYCENTFTSCYSYENDLWRDLGTVYANSTQTDGNRIKPYPYPQH